MVVAAYLAIAALGLCLGWVVGIDGAQWFGVPVSFICALVAFTVNWIAFIPAWRHQSEKYYDLVGSISYLTVVLVALSLANQVNWINLAVASMVAIWCIRLGSMLFMRIRATGEDVRFRKIKTDFARFFGTWTLQGMWVLTTLLCVLAQLTRMEQTEFGFWFALGSVMWVAGFAIEVIADRQKNVFRQNPENRGRFIKTGLWRWSQHPNYFGEILLWTGIAFAVLPSLNGWGFVSLISPVFVFVLLTKVSGIPTLDAVAKKRWSNDPEYQFYIQNTSKLVPLPPRGTYGKATELTQ